MSVLAFASVLTLASFDELIALVASVALRTSLAITWASCALVMRCWVCILCCMRLRNLLSIGPRPFTIEIPSDRINQKFIASVVTSFRCAFINIKVKSELTGLPDLSIE